MNDLSARGQSGASIALVGLGNIGSQTAALLAGVETIGRVLLCDPDRYAASNRGQKIAAADAGRYKVEVQAKFLRRAAPQIEIEACAQPIESLPLGALRGHVVLACVDSRIARQSINRVARALGTLWIDSALDRGGQVRSRIYWPDASDGDCLECAWGPRDYELLEQRVPCAGQGATGSAPEIRPTAAPLELGAVAAGLQVTLLRSVLAGGRADATVPGRQLFFDVSSGRGWVGTYTRNPACRLDHAPWQIIELARSASNLALREALRLPGGDGKDNAIALDGQMFVQRLRCARCRVSRTTARCLSSRIRPRACRKCGGVMTASAADATDILTARKAPPQWLDAPLSAFGLVDGDIFTVRSKDGTSHYQLCGIRKEAN